MLEPLSERRFCLAKGATENGETVGQLLADFVDELLGVLGDDGGTVRVVDT